MRNSLFVKVYLTLLASLVVVALASAVFVRFSHDEEDRGWAARRDAFLAAMLPANTDEQETRIMLARLGEAFDADITVFTADGGTIASVGTPLPFATPGDRDHFRRGEDRRRLSARLPDGRVVVARLSGNFFGPPRANPLIWLALIAGITGLIAWPVVRHLTGRLERLRRGVEVWGGGDLALRAPVEGKDEVAAVAESFNRAAERIEGLVAAHRSLLANASHELRSPLARLRMASDLNEAAPSQARRREIMRNLSELDELVEEILLASRLDHAGTVELTDDVDLLALVAEEGARHSVEVTGEAATVKGNARLLARLVRNLIQNALRHGAPPVSAEVRRHGSAIELVVRDHGQGIAEAERERVFEPFYRPSGRSEHAGGWGLGLSLVRQIAQHHGANVQQEGSTDGGACFIVTFPTKHD
ncbi:sensor histidine kinase [Aquamicrobium defluvii]|uniref:histidine kinase n=1 Tax=Aquamicrobium defluvii TaxID=69279 RepID=A0A011STX5_9HYPH|nr:HAMP domain-containing sensor histidine kinase [Aquamicrobium defluvii]EXL02669.1 histidine kinase [Aquamicrobium defluvii]EZQ13287.1 histidine kinase [Halopseudomonas bauzanensis]